MDVNTPLYPDNVHLNSMNTFLHTIEGVDVYRGAQGRDVWVFLAWGDTDPESAALWPGEPETSFDFPKTPSEAAKEYARGILALIS